MNGPETRPGFYRSETGDELCPSVPRTIAATDRSSVSSWMDNSVNKATPYLWFNGVLAALAIGLSIGAFYSANQARAVIDNAANESKRIAEREARLTQIQVDDLKSQLRTQGFKIQSHELP